MTNLLTEINEVQKRVGHLPGPRDLKVINHIDSHAKKWLSVSTLAMIAFSSNSEINITIVGGDKEFTLVNEKQQLVISVAKFDEAKLIKSGMSFGSLFLISSLNETLRVNGKVSSVTTEFVFLDVKECYLHCGKALKRSNFWNVETTSAPSEIVEFFRLCPWLVVASVNAIGQVDVSPKGDPPENLLIRKEGYVWYPDRPGNRRIDSFRNIIENERIAIIALIPGCSSIMKLLGTAAISTDKSIRKLFVVKDKQPTLVTRVKPQKIHFAESAAITNSRIWDGITPPDDIDPAEIFKTHIMMSKAEGDNVTEIRSALKSPGLLQKELDYDYKNNMY